MFRVVGQSDTAVTTFLTKMGFRFLMKKVHEGEFNVDCTKEQASVLRLHSLKKKGVRVL